MRFFSEIEVMFCIGLYRKIILGREYINTLFFFILETIFKKNISIFSYEPGLFSCVGFAFSKMFHVKHSERLCFYKSMGITKNSSITFLELFFFFIKLFGDV